MAAAAKIEEFYDKGGMVIATGMLPTRSAEFGKDKEVRQAIADVFRVSPDEPLKADLRRAQDRQNFYVFWYDIKKNKAGGQALFLPNTNPWLIDFSKALRIWNPHTGGEGAAEYTAAESNGQPITTVRLVLPAVSSLFFIQD